MCLPAQREMFAFCVPKVAECLLRPLVRQGKFPSKGEITALDHLIGDSHAQARLYGTFHLLRSMAR